PGSAVTAGGRSGRCRPAWTARRSSTGTGPASRRPESPGSCTGRNPPVSPTASKRPSKARDLIPERPSVPNLRDAAAGCRACALWERGTQTVFGEGSAGSDVMLVGEQPGDREDVEGRPFVGPAGQLLDRALEAAGIDRRKVYV